MDRTEKIRKPTRETHLCEPVGRAGPPSGGRRSPTRTSRAQAVHPARSPSQGKDEGGEGRRRRRWRSTRFEAVRLGGITQWVRMRGANPSNPVLLLMQQGPGLPIINDARVLARLLGLEEAFTVVYWDQRGTGLSAPPLRRGPDRFEISVARMVGDTVSLLEFLRDRFGRQDLRRRVLLRRDVRRIRRRAAPGSRGGAGGGRDGHRYSRRRERTPTTSRSTPPVDAATGARSGSWRPSGGPRTSPRNSSPPGPAGRPTSAA